MVTDYNFNTIDSTYGKTIIDFLDGMRFDTNAWGKGVRDGHVTKNFFFDKRDLPASKIVGSKKQESTFFPENPIELCDYLQLILQENYSGN